jgi:hypothetical protein
MYRRFKKAVVERTGAGESVQSSTPLVTPKSARSAPNRRKRQATSDSEEECAPTPTPKNSRPARKSVKVSRYNDTRSDDEDIPAQGSDPEETETKKHGRSSNDTSGKSSGKSPIKRATKQLDKEPEDETTVEKSPLEDAVYGTVKEEESQLETSTVVDLDDDIA